MIYNYFLLAWRHLLTNRTVSFINIFGLSIAVACCISVFLFLQNYWTLDNFHEHGERIFLVEYVTETNGGDQAWADAPAPVAAALATDFPQVERVVRIHREAVKVFNKENVLNEILTYADAGFFQMFTFPLRLGDPGALADPNAIILSATMAEKYFGNTMPIGLPIVLVTEDLERKRFMVQGVAEPFPYNTSFAFDLLTGHHSVHAALKEQDWQSRTGGVFVQLRQPQDAALLAPQMQRFVAPFNANNPETPIESFVLDNLRHPAPKAYNVNRRPVEAHHPLLTLIFSFIALTMLALSCFNYINISLGAVTRRLKEIGMRKVIGGKRGQLIAQFLTENLLLCFGALVFGLMLAESIFVPVLNDIMVLKIDLSFSKNLGLWLFLSGLLAFSGLASGMYPALYISSFKPAVIFAGRQKLAVKNTLRRGLLILQFVLAFLAIIVTVLLLTTARQWEKLTWGYNPGQTLVVQLAENSQFNLLKNELVKAASILRVDGSSNHIGQSYSRATIQTDTKNQDVFRFDVGADYLEILGLDLHAGRFFEESRRVEDESAVMVNEAFVKTEGWQDAIGQTVRADKQEYTVVGVVGDFKIFGTGVVHPTIFFRVDASNFGYLVARFAAGNEEQAVAQLQDIWQGLFPGTPVNYFMQKDVFDGFFHTFRKVSASFGYIAGLALIIACMGLYGLALQHFSRRLKEMGVRKLLGARLAHILMLVNREFLALLLVAGGIATLVSFVGVRLLLHSAEEFVGPYRPGVEPFLLANLIVFATAVIAIGRQSWNVARVNLSEVLKNAE